MKHRPYVGKNYADNRAAVQAGEEKYKPVVPCTQAVEYWAGEDSRGGRTLGSRYPLYSLSSEHTTLSYHSRTAAESNLLCSGRGRAV
jgi:hypothetical protein